MRFLEMGIKRCAPIGGCRSSGPDLTPRGEVNLFGQDFADSIAKTAFRFLSTRADEF